MSVLVALKELETKMNANPTHIQEVKGVLQFDVTGDSTEAYQVEFANGHVSLNVGELTTPACTLQLSEENLEKLLQGQLNATTAVFTGKLKVKGDIGFALKIQSVLQKYS